MDNTVNLSLSTENIIAILGIVVTLIIAIIGGIYAIVTNTKKFELTENYKQELLSWYSSVNKIMMKIIHFYEINDVTSVDFSETKFDLLSELSSLTEVGRFYFPNVIKQDGYGENKPSAYQGYRHITLEFLLYFYKVAKEDDCKKQLPTMWELERRFTSVIFDMIEPRKKIKKYSKQLTITIPENQSILDYIQESPESLKIFVH